MEWRLRCPFKIGEEIVCIDDKGLVTLIKNHTYVVATVKGKLYDNVGVKNDSGVVAQYGWDRFVSLQEYRKLKLQNIEKFL